jgi:hypothetical protein
MRLTDIFEQGTVGSTPLPSPGGSSVPPTTQSVTLGGNTAQLQDPKLAAANLAKQNQDKATRRKAIQDQMSSLRQQLRSLQTELANLNNPA